MDEQMDSTDKLLCALSYPIWPIAIFLLLMKKENRTCRYHAFMSFVPILGGIFFLLIRLAGLVVLVYSIKLAIDTNNGQYPTIPYITQFVSKYVDQV
jgi:uncharacterized membrane protein